MPLRTAESATGCGTLPVGWESAYNLSWATESASPVFLICDYRIMPHSNQPEAQSKKRRSTDRGNHW